MDVVIDWESLPWKEPSPGVRVKTCVRGDQVVSLLELSEGSNQDWCTKGHLIYVLAGEATARLPALVRPPLSMTTGFRSVAALRARTKLGPSLMPSI